MYRRGQKKRPEEWSYYCPSCGRSSTGLFCSTCGEDQLRGKDYSLVGHLGEAFKVLTNMEAGFFRSFRELIASPGFLTNQYFAGRRKPYLKPLQIFLFCNIIFFFVQSHTRFNTLSTPLEVYTQQLPYSRYARAKVSKTIIDRGITFKEYQVRFDATIESQSKILVALMIPMFALLLQALYWRARNYFVEHLVFSIHFFSCFLLILSADLLLTTAMARVAHRFSRLDAIFNSDRFSMVVLLVVCLGYLLFAVRRVYTQIWVNFVYTPGWVSDALKCVILIGGLRFIMEIYRFCLFFTTFYWV